MKCEGNVENRACNCLLWETEKKQQKEKKNNGILSGDFKDAGLELKDIITCGECLNINLKDRLNCITKCKNGFIVL